jgi:hypothetical protein
VKEDSTFKSEVKTRNAYRMLIGKKSLKIRTETGRCSCCSLVCRLCKEAI